MEVTTGKLVAQEILSQLGGRQFLVMTGTKNLVCDSKEQSLTMRLTKNKLHAKWMKIRLNGLDLYDVTFMTENKSRTAIITLKEVSNVYGDMLRGLFERETGLRTSLTHIYN